jgi:hypothetical protein
MKSAIPRARTGRARTGRARTGRPKLPTRPQTVANTHLIRQLRVRVMVFNATFNNISVISWRSVLLLEETGVPGENHRPVTSH